ncbi:hypothetical protein BDV95DRAFT_584493 [Massariosphaeria phaeospora]|uniref:CUE domain-containing protein n=1 Tax=Massariosphaeria phaeospora TaxID=100035 RepID=A0A7C8I7E2_9PLEO|nr:hypothetical protein BDV95DRAFT_584493 [Massariosphaeria phaeospora]
MAEKAAGEKPTRIGTASGAPESPTTARELDFDDDIDAPAAAAATATATAHDTMASPPPPSKSPKPAVRFSDEATEIPPTKPPRPVNTQQQAETTLIEAFPGIDAKVVKAVLVASGGKVEPAFNALLSMSDPDFKGEEAPPPQPPRPAQQQQQQQQQPQPRQPRSQVEQDEIYARQLAEHYQSGFTQPYGQRSRSNQPEPHQRRETGLKPNELYDDREHSFFDDDLPEIRKNIEQGFRETQTKVKSWITDFTKTLAGEPDEYDQYGNPVAPQGSSSHHQPPQQRQNFGPSQSDQMYGIRKSAEQRRSADRERYDMDNRVLGDDFEALELHDDEGLFMAHKHRQHTVNPGPAPAKPNRPLANPNLFKPTPVSPPQSGPVDEVDALYRNPSPNNNAQGKAGGGKKWQPLTSVAPHPEPDDHDPFSLGDSDEEDAKVKDIKAEDTERLKKAAEGKEGVETGVLTEADKSGHNDAAAEALLKNAK